MWQCGNVHETKGTGTCGRRKACGRRAYEKENGLDRQQNFVTAAV